MSLWVKLASRKLWICIFVILLTLTAAFMGVIDWPYALATIKGTVAFYLGAQGAIDVTTAIEGIIAKLWQKKLEEMARKKLEELTAPEALKALVPRE